MLINYMLFYLEKLFNNYEIDANYFGHPLLEHVLDFQKNSSDSRDEFFKKYELDKSKNIISLPLK